MTFAAKALIATAFGGGALLLIEQSPHGAAIIGALSAMMWLLVLKDVLDFLRWAGM